MNNKIEKSNYEIANEEIRKSIEGTKVVENEISTGTSFFEGKKRLCKILKSKKSIEIECNVNLPKDIEKEFNLTKISMATAKAKHMGTMKYLIKINDIKNLSKIVQAMVESFKAELNAEKLAKEKLEKAN